MITRRISYQTDLQHLVDIDLKCFELAWSAEEWAEARIRDTVTVLSNYGDPIGFIALRGVEDAAEIRKVAIKSRYRKQQLSYQLMESAILFARQKRFNSIFIIIPEAMIETVGPWLAKFNFTAKKPIIRDAFHAYGKPENGVKFVCRL